MNLVSREQRVHNNFWCEQSVNGSIPERQTPAANFRYFFLISFINNIRRKPQYEYEGSLNMHVAFSTNSITQIQKNV